MFNPVIIEESLAGLIGFRQHHNAAYDRYDSDLAASSAGTYIDSSAHSLLTVENIASIAENFSKTDVTVYSAAVTYAKGDVIKDGAVIYESKVAANINHTPASSTTQWRVTNLLSAYLRRLVNSASLNLFNAVFSHRKLYESAKTLLTDTALYDGVGNLTRKIGKLSRFVGFQVSPNFPDTVITINWAGFQFDSANPNFKLYVYHSSLSDPLMEINLALNKPISFDWNELSEAIQLYFNSSATNTKGSFYIGYYEDDLVGQAIWKEQTFSGAGCSSCNGVNSYLFRQWNKYFTIFPVYVEEAWLDGDRKLFDTEKIIELSNQNWGLNFRIQVQCDVTDLIVRNKFAFIDALKKQVVHDLIRDMAYSMRDNQRKEKVTQLAHYALENKENSTKGLVKELEEAVKNVSFDLSTLSAVCLPCAAAGQGLTVSSVF